MKSSPLPLPISRRWALALLCAVQSCERFAFLAMLPMFVKYAHERHGVAAPQGLLILSGFQALAYLGGLPGGWLADRVLGAGKATLLGAGLLACGYSLLVLERTDLLWPALLTLLLGQSAFRPGLHALLATVADTDNQARERVFLWHYLAVNIGYAAGALYGEWAHARAGWSLLFKGATVMSIVSILLLAIRFRGAGGQPRPVQGALSRVLDGSDSGNMRAVWLLCGMAVIFWLTAQQAGSSLTVFATDNTAQRVTLLGHTVQIGPGHFASLHGLIVLALLPAFLVLHGRKTEHAPSATDLMIWGYVATSAAFALMALAGLSGGDLGRVSSAWLVGCYLLLSLAEVLLAPLGMSLMTKLAPKDKTAQAVGLWFAGSSLGNGLAGALGLLWERWPHHRYFAVPAILSLAAAVVLRLLRRQLDGLGGAASGESVSPMPSTVADRLRAESSDAGLGPCSASQWLTALSIVLPGALVLHAGLPLPVRGVSAIVSGLAILLGGPHLYSHALDRWARSSTR
jgi:POT family proton-dependent oligopeptide transporter